jgi:hypothetical protein
MSLSFRWYDIEGNEDDWDRLVDGTQGGVFHRSAVLEVERQGAERRVGVLVDREGSHLATIGGLADRREATPRFRTAAFPPLDTIGDRQLVVRLLSWLREERVRHVELGSYSSGVEGYDLDVSDIQRLRRWEFLVDLRRTEADLWSDLSSTHRRQARRTLEGGATLECLRTGGGRILAQARAHWEGRSGRRLGIVRRLRSLRRHARLVRTLTGSGRLYVLRDSARHPLATAYVLQSDVEAYYMVGASWPDGYARGASIGLFWKLILELRSLGVTRFNLGGVPHDAMHDGHAEHGVYRFKRGFGTDRRCRLGASGAL